ncbi:MAG: hypothetical protein A2091_01870 [Desulfuromonadales bacterium GWD2_61_12]|nr:MAG: hypothetical protein A2005_06055 [Desulfuromonadales bacterium GWC2_61_20]OGR35728.1 MAG: hypothetical protein A2091_01870 [Desulfuromonadales bacterium GWD2_61_12]
MQHNLDQSMCDVNFLPWIGDAYFENKWNGNLLILGESHYSVDDDDKYATRQLTKDYIDNKWSHPFWTNIMQVVTGAHHSQQSRENFWQTVSFYNYIQASLDEARMAPDNQMWEAAKIPFMQVVNALSPDKILVLGYRLWDGLNIGGKSTGTITENGTELDLWAITRPDGSEIILGCIKHPSSGFSSETWAPLVKKFIEHT